MSSISISCLPPKPPPMRGLMTRIALTGEAERRRHDAAAVEGNLGRGADHEAPVGVEPGDA